MEELALVKDEAEPLRLALAIAGQQAILHGTWLHNASHLDALHRCEILLKDSLEWDFLITGCRPYEYEFLHLYTNIAGDLAEKTDITITIPMLIKVLEAVLSTTNYIQEKYEKDERYRPEVDLLAFQPRDQLEPILQPLYDLFPAGIALLGFNMTARNEVAEKDWARELLERSIHILREGNKLLKARGLGDRE